MDTSKIQTWIKANMLLAVGIAAASALILFPGPVKKMFGSTTKRRRRRITSVNSHRRRVHHTITGSHRRMKGAKKPWQVKGSLAAKRHMALIRKRR